MGEYSHNCGTCSFYMPANGKFVCANGSKYFSYGDEIPDEFADRVNDCEEYEPSLWEFIAKEEKQ